MRNVPVICGPTAAGKSAIAMALAEWSGATLISADSRQVYRGFDIGTAKPSNAEQQRVPHCGVDVCEPTERYSAAQWTAAATRWLDQADAAGRPAIIVGGTGFYLRALDEPLFESPPLDPVARAQVQTELDALSTPELRARCEQLDPARAHLGRTQLLRAIETSLLTGRPLSAWMRENARPATVAAHYLLVDPGAVLREKIAARVQAMLDAGWEAEVATLSGTVPADAPAWNACGYGALREAMVGACSRSQAIERTIIDTRQYAKRQRTWFRHQLPAGRVTLLDPVAADAIGRAQTWLDSVSSLEPL